MGIHLELCGFSSAIAVELELQQLRGQHDLLRRFGVRENVASCRSS